MKPTIAPSQHELLIDWQSNLTNADSHAQVLQNIQQSFHEFSTHSLCKQVTLNFEQQPELGMETIYRLVKIFKLLRSKQCRLRICGVSQQSQRLLALLRLDQSWSIEQSVAA